MEYQTSDAAPGHLFREQHDSSTAPVQFQRTGVHPLSSPVSPQGIFVAKLKKQQTCRKAGRTEMCLSCKNPKLKSKCEFTTLLPVRSKKLPGKAAQVITMASCRKAKIEEMCEGCKKKNASFEHFHKIPKALLNKHQNCLSPNLQKSKSL